MSITEQLEVALEAERNRDAVEPIITDYVAFLARMAQLGLVRPQEYNLVTPASDRRSDALKATFLVR